MACSTRRTSSTINLRGKRASSRLSFDRTSSTEGSSRSWSWEVKSRCYQSRRPGTCYLPFFMASINLLVISDPKAPHLRVLDKIAQPVNMRIGQDLEFVQREAPGAEVILCANFKPEPFRTILPLAKRLAWVHSSSAGVESLLFPEFVAS